VDGATSNLLYFFLRLKQIKLKVFRFIEEHDLIETTGRSIRLQISAQVD
jgi:hypothetical protein